MKLRVPGNYTGDYGPVPFKDGVSTRLVTAREVNHLKAIFNGVEVLQDDGETVDEVLNSMSVLLPLGYYTDINIPAPSVYLTDWEAKYPEGYGPDAPPKAAEPAPVTEPITPEPNTEAPVIAVAGVWTREQLEALADEGIAKLRTVAEPLGVKGRSIVELIDGIMAHQLAKAEEAAAAE